MKTTVTFNLDFWAPNEIYPGRGRVQMQKIVQFDCIPRYEDRVFVGDKVLYMDEAIYSLDNSAAIKLSDMNSDIVGKEALPKIANYVCNLGFSVMFMAAYEKGYPSDKNKKDLFPGIEMTPEGLSPYLDERK